jgi:glycosyltransferase involved in cell wall biosynthesis
MRVLLVNAYSMENAYELWRKGTSGSHHVWGKVELEKNSDIKVIIFPHEKYRFLNKIGSLLKISNLDQQLRMLKHLNSFDILYAPYSTANTRFLLFLKWLGIFRKPIVVTMHQPFLGSTSQNAIVKRMSKNSLLLYDKTIFLSEKLKEKTIDQLGIPPDEARNKFTTAQWGPDTEFYKCFDTNIPLAECDYAISAGHTDRDYETLIKAFKDVKFKLKIFCTPRSMPKNVEIPENVEVHSEFTPYIELMKHYTRARMILIPLSYPSTKEGCQGMTSIQDVVALGKPTIITKNPMLNIDVEKEGFGVAVEKGSVNGWIQTLNQLLFDTDQLEKMRTNALRVYQQKYNSIVFSEKLKKVFESVYHNHMRIQ